MDNHKKSNPSLGVESHGSYLCNKCGWNFPNPHPSAKHRRAHKKVCGKIDDDLTVVVSDEDPLSPSPKSGNRLEEEAFVDSVMEISESGLKSPGKSEQVEEAVGVVDNATEQKLKVVDTAEDCIEKPNIGKDSCLKDNLDILETQENHLGTNTDAVSEEIVSVAAPSLDKTSVEISSFNVAPSNIVEEDTKVEDLNLGSMVQDFSTEVESHQEEEDNNPVDESVHVFNTKEPKDELCKRNNTEVNLEEDTMDRETIELEKPPQNLSSLKHTVLNGNDGNKGGLTMDDDKIEILPPHGNNDDAEFSSLADDADAIDKGGSLRHNLDETPINELGNSAASEEVAFADSTSDTDSTMTEVRPNEDQIEVPHHADILSVIKANVSSDPPCLKEDQEDSNNLSAGTTYFDVSHPVENSTADNLKMVIPESNSMNQIEKVVDKKDDILLGDITRIESMNVVPKLSTDDDDETQMISQIPSEMVVDKHLSEDSISNNHGNDVVNGVSSAINEFLNSQDQDSRNTHLLAKQQQFDGSSSQGEDSVEGIWGSISVLSTQSDGQQCLNTVAPPSQPNTDKSDAAAFDPPSFMTLVEEDPHKEKEQKTQQPISELVLQAAFPSVTNTNIGKETPGRKKNEEMISKVANWSMPKQHTPLKSLLYSETNSSSSPNWKEQQQTAVNQNEEEKSSLIKGDDDPAAGKGWNNNSPSKYPTTNTGDETKKEKMKKKKKVKGRPNWIQCVCCSSVH